MREHAVESRLAGSRLGAGQPRIKLIGFLETSIVSAVGAIGECAMPWGGKRETGVGGGNIAWGKKRPVVRAARHTAVLEAGAVWGSLRPYIMLRI